MMSNQLILFKIKEINEILKSKENKKISKQELKNLIQKKIGCFKDATIILPEVMSKYNTKGIVFVDGSVNQIGNSYPYEISLYRAGAMLVKKGSHIKENYITEESIFSPIIKSDRKKILEIIEESDKDITYESAFLQFKKRKLAELELSVAIKSIKQNKPSLVVLDGGFTRFKLDNMIMFEEFLDLCISTDTQVVGCIEEISTNEISRHLGTDLPESMQQDYDRELLFGLLNPKEWIFPYKGVKFKKGFLTCFARLSEHPQAIGFDFLPQQSQYVEDIISVLAAITPMQSRGIPYCLDVIDREVRITSDFIEKIFKNGLDKDIQEKFLIAHRDRR